MNLLPLSIRKRIKNIRTLYNKRTRTHYYSANDICACLIDGTYTQGKSYWKSIKSRNDKFNIASGGKTTMLTLPAADGKWYATDVISHTQLLHLIRIIKHKNALLFKQWATVAMKNLNVYSGMLRDIGAVKRVVLMDMIRKMGKEVLLYSRYIARVYDVSARSLFHQRRFVF